MADIREKEVKSLSGIPFLLILALITAFLVLVIVASDLRPAKLAALILGIPFLIVGLSGLYKVEPNQSAVLSLFGKYIGTVRTAGLRFNNPFFTKKKISLRVRNFESGKLKVNELDGSPI